MIVIGYMVDLKRGKLLNVFIKLYVITVCVFYIWFYFNRYLLFLRLCMQDDFSMSPLNPVWINLCDDNVKDWSVGLEDGIKD